MREFVLKRVTNKEWVQNALVEFIADGCMVIVGILGAYLIKVYVLPF